MTKKERQNMEMIEYKLQMLLDAERSWCKERLQEEIKEYGHNQLKNELIAKLRELKIKSVFN